eukprot:1155864-Pelagomonas_calceolata.AAC.1
MLTQGVDSFLWYKLHGITLQVAAELVTIEEVAVQAGDKKGNKEGQSGKFRSNIQSRLGHGILLNLKFFSSRRPSAMRGVTCSYSPTNCLAEPPFRGNAHRGASPMVYEFHTPFHTRPLRLTHGTSGSKNQNATITQLVRKNATVRDTPVHVVLSSAKKVS